MTASLKVYKKIITLLAYALLGSLFWSCNGDKTDNLSTTSFRVEFSSSQALSSSPFPSNHYLNDAGKVQMAPLENDPILGNIAKSDFLKTLSTRILERDGFSYAAPVFFFVDEEINIASAATQIQYITLTGPEKGRIVQSQAFWSPHGQALGVMQAWGDYLMPGATYGVVIRDGISFVSGKKVNPGSIWPELFATTQPTSADSNILRGREILKPLRDYLESQESSLDDIVAATVFTTEKSIPYAEAAFKAIDNFFNSSPIPKPSRNIRYNNSTQEMEIASVISGAALTDFFGTPTSPFEINPGSWSNWSRTRAAALEENDEYTGGSFHQGIGMVLNGTMAIPALNFQHTNDLPENTALTIENGIAQSSINAMVPFTIHVCEEHLQTDGTIVDQELPIALFVHGGTASRNDALSFALVNCLEGIATIGYDLPFHGGRTSVKLLDDNGQLVLAPTALDQFNTYTGREVEQGLTDYIGDLTGATQNVGQLYGLASNLDPAVVEANLMTIAAETYAVTRYVQEGDWSDILPGLRFDRTRIFNQSQSYGMSFTQAVYALRNEYAGILMGVGSSYMVMANVPMAPSNALLGSGFMGLAMGLKTTPAELQNGAYKDPIIAIHQWLCGRSDASGYAPYVLRHRQDEKSINLLQIGNSWDQTLSTFAQLSLDAALGTPAFRYGSNWTLNEDLPHGKDYGEIYSGTPISENALFNGRKHTAALFYHSNSCHSLMTSPLCSRSYELSYPPIIELAEPIAYPSPICEYQNMARGFMRQVLLGSPEIGPPEGTCEQLYSTQN